MGKIKVVEEFRLYGVSEKPGRKRRFKLVRLAGDAINKTISSDAINDTLTKLANALYIFDGGGRCYEVIGCKTDSEKVLAGIEDEKLIWIPNIMSKIDVDIRACQFFILVNEELTDYQWIVAVSQQKIYEGSE